MYVAVKCKIQTMKYNLEFSSEDSRKCRRSMIIASPPRCHFYSCWLKRFNGLVTGVPHLIDIRQRVLKHLLIGWTFGTWIFWVTIFQFLMCLNPGPECSFVSFSLWRWCPTNAGQVKDAANTFDSCLSSCCLMFNVFSRGTSNSLYILSWVLKGNKETQTEFKFAMITYILVLC